MYQQVIFENMKEIIKEFPPQDRPALTHAAETWRLPYWDWGSKRPTFETPDDVDYDVPHLARLETVHIRCPPDKTTGKTRKWIKNPIFSFRMPGGITMGEAGVNFKDYFWWDKDVPNTKGPFTDVSLTQPRKASIMHMCVLTVAVVWSHQGNQQTCPRIGDR